MGAAAFAGAAAGAAGGIYVTISDQVGVVVGTSESSTGVKLLRNGQYHYGESTLSTTPDYGDVGGVEWASRESTAIGDAYEARMVTITGTLTVGTADTWQALSTDREYEVSQSGAGTASFTGTLQIRAGVTILDTASISLEAIVVPS